MVGFVVGYGVLSGDSLGRVNLLFLLMLFTFVPVIGLIMSIGFIIGGGGRGLAGWILELPILPPPLAVEILNLGLSGSRKSWLFYQTQVLALSFALGGLLVYLLLLIGSDISFIRRSTHISNILGAPVEVRGIEPLPLASATDNAVTTQSMLVLVKSWEPPLGELGDYLHSLSGSQQKFILPLDWGEGMVKPITANHLNEWRRFCGSLSGWQLLQLDASP